MLGRSNSKTLYCSYTTNDLPLVASLLPQDDLGYTPLHAALSQSKDGANFDVVSYLLSATKNITNLKTRWFISPLDIGEIRQATKAGAK